MKKSIIITVAVGLIAVASIGAYAHGGWGGYYGWGNYGGPMMGRMYGSGPMMGGWSHRGGGYGYCGGYSKWNTVAPGWNAPGQPGTAFQAPQMITEAKVKEIAESYAKQYLPGYTIDKVEKDAWRPLYFVTVKGENNATLKLVVHGFVGQVMNIFPELAEQAPEQN